MSDKETMKFKYIFPDDYNPVYANGAHGGITAKGEIVINFFFERHAIPNSQSYEITNEGTLGAEAGTDPEDLKQSMVRYVENGVILSLEHAKVINRWLKDHINTLDKLEQEENGELK